MIYVFKSFISNEKTCHSDIKQDTHKQYQSTAASFIKLQTSSLKDVAHQKKRLKQLAQNIKRYKFCNHDVSCNDHNMLIHDDD